MASRFQKKGIPPFAGLSLVEAAARPHCARVFQIAATAAACLVFWGV